MNHLLTWIAILAVVLAPRVARAGDPEAHALAAEQAVSTVANEPAFVNGLGAPSVAGVVQRGKFLVQNRPAVACPFSPDNPFGAGCAYSSIAAEAINEPDDWKCSDPRQPDIMNSINNFVAPYQTDFATAMAARISELATVCNWNHFTSNPALPPSGNRDANAAMTLVSKDAADILSGIETNGATNDAACDLTTFTAYIKRIYNSLHYTQDQVCEDHNAGNLVCINTDFIPLFNAHPIYNFTQGRACMTWLGDTIGKAIGPNPIYKCDQALMSAGTMADVELNSNMIKVGLLCGFGVGVNGNTFNLVLTARYPVTSLACAGLERTLRHHCLLDTPKSLSCFGPPSDHSSVSPDGTWCEGETNPGPMGQDFIGLAEAATEPVLRTAWQKFADVCKQPDDPCIADQCSKWCQRTVGTTMDGYCVNTIPDTNCTLHTCKCDFKTNCGVQGLPCCPGANPCPANLECGGQTGTCEPKGQEMCVAGLVNGDFSQGLTGWTVSATGSGSVTINNSVSYDCLTSQNGNNFAFIAAYEGTGTLSQTFRVPANATTLTLRAWDNLDPTTATVSISASGQASFTETFTPPSMQKLSDPNDYYSVVCTGLSPVMKTFPISAYAGQNVTLQLTGSYVSGVNGTYTNFDDVSVR